MGEVILLDTARTKTRPTNPQERIKTAADVWLVDSILGAAEEMMARLLYTDQPLKPDERARVMRASAALLTQPES